MSPFKTKKGASWPMRFSAFFIGPPVPSGFFGGSREYVIFSPCLEGLYCFIATSVWKLIAIIASFTLFLASLSKVHSISGLLTIGKRILGLVQLNGLSLVPKPPARMTAFKQVHRLDLRLIFGCLSIKRFCEEANNE